jgi:DNA-binding IclR family transcriptional regulator
MSCDAIKEDPSSTLLQTISVLDERETVGVTELADELGVAKSTAHYHLDTLWSQGFVVKDGTQYRLGLRFLGIGLRTRRRIPIFDVAKKEIDKLASETGELAILSIEQRGLGVFIYKSGGSDAVDIDAEIGEGATMHNRALGKAMLAQYDEQRVGEIIDRHGLPQTTEHTITTRKELREELRDVRDANIAFNREESLEGIHGVGVPITSGGGDVLGAMSIAGPAKRLNGTIFTEDCPSLLSRARNVVELNYQHKQNG